MRSRYDEFSLAHAPMVEAFWSLDAQGEARRILPDGCIDFIFNLDTGFGRAVGTMQSSQVVSVPAGARRFGVRFAPGAAAALLDVRADELTDDDVELSAVSRAARFCIAERVAHARDDAERARIIIEFLQARQSRVHPHEPRVLRAVAVLRRSHGAGSIAEIAAGVGVGERQLERLFRERVGARPKLFARVLRMQRALALLEARAHPGVGQAAHALAAGFADQSHLVRDFRALAGVTPQRLVTERRVGIVQSQSLRAD